jgi:hypothetical protein
MSFGGRGGQLSVWARVLEPLGGKGVLPLKEGKREGNMLLVLDGPCFRIESCKKG